VHRGRRRRERAALASVGAARVQEPAGDERQRASIKIRPQVSRASCRQPKDDRPARAVWLSRSRGRRPV
jgi:hypothetical protein